MHFAVPERLILLEKILYYNNINGLAVEHMYRQGSFDMVVNHFHNEYEIFFLREGERHFFFDNRAYLVTGGDLILVDTNRVHMTRSISDQDKNHDRIILYVADYRMREFDQKYPSLGLVRFFKEECGVFKLTPQQQQRYMSMYNRLHDEFEHGGPYSPVAIELEVLHYLMDLLRDNYQKSPIKTAAQTSGARNQYTTVYNVADYISAHFAEPITLDGLAKQFYLSKYHLCRTFKQITGVGITEYINVLRIQRAKQLLEQTNDSVSKIAMEVGYNSITYFEKLFRTYMNISPLQYQKTLHIVGYTNVISQLGQVQSAATDLAPE